jgi:hypothetical protein
MQALTHPGDYRGNGFKIRPFHSGRDEPGGSKNSCVRKNGEIELVRLPLFLRDEQPQPALTIGTEEDISTRKHSGPTCTSARQSRRRLAAAASDFLAVEYWGEKNPGCQ